MSTGLTNAPAAAGGTLRLGDDLTVNRLGYGAMRLTGPGFWGEPTDPDEAVRVVRRAVELGVNFIDTADAYGPFSSDRIIRRRCTPTPTIWSSPPRSVSPAPAPTTGARWDAPNTCASRPS